MEEHTATVNMNQKNHNDYTENQRKLIHKLQEEIKQKQEDNKEMMSQITSDGDTEWKEIVEKHDKNLKQVTDMGLKAKADLQITRNKL